MKKTLFLLLSFLFCFTACNKQRLQKKPADLIPSNTMSSIISDILLIESMINLAPADSNRVNMMNMYYQDLFVHYNISKEQFQESISYYLSNENDTEKLSDMVKLEMEQLEKEYSDHEPLQKEEEDENRIAPE